jgi:hypothetical protein
MEGSKLRLAWDYTLENDVSKKNYTIVVTMSQTAALSYRHTFRSRSNRRRAMAACNYA